MHVPKIIIALLILVTSCGYNAERKTAPKAVNGIIDLTGWDFDKDGPVKLNGQWDFYWGKFIDPNDIITNNIEEKNIIPKFLDYGQMLLILLLRKKYLWIDMVVLLMYLKLLAFLREHKNLFI